MDMKKSHIKILVVAAGISVTALLAGVMHSANAIARYQAGLSDVTSISVFMENYKSEHGAYPPSLQKLASDEIDIQTKDKIIEVLNKHFSCKYEYKPMTNGFAIILNGYEYKYAAFQSGFSVAGQFSTNTVSFGN